MSFNINSLLRYTLFLPLIWSSCKEPADDNTVNHCFPEEVGKIITTYCSLSGCHNDKSYEAAGNLNLSTWEKLFLGGNHNSVVIPFRPDQSVMMFYINTDSTAGPILEPHMPYEREPLTDAQIATIRDWITAGAPDCEGQIKFSDNASRPKVYIPNQGCDMVAVIDLETKLIMRYIDVGAASAIESPHSSRISPDGQHWYQCFSNEGTVFQKFRTSDDARIGQVFIGSGSWNTFAITSDSRYAFVVDFNTGGAIAQVDLETMTLKNKYTDGLSSPHGSALKDDTTLYVTAQYGNFIYKLNVAKADDPVITTVVLQPGETPSTVSKHDPHEIAFSPDNSQYAVTCQTTNEVRFFSAANDSLLAIVPTGTFPQEIAFSTITDYVFISCPEDKTTFPGNTGSVAVINYKTHSLIKQINPGFQPHGIGVDDPTMQVFVANRNANPDGPAPHHTSNCGGRNGYFTVIDMNTLELNPAYRVELSVDPYFVAVRR